jgi:hypothetical protein
MVCDAEHVCQRRAPYLCGANKDDLIGMVYEVVAGRDRRAKLRVGAIQAALPPPAHRIKSKQASTAD